MDQVFAKLNKTTKTIKLETDKKYKASNFLLISF